MHTIHKINILYIIIMLLLCSIGKAQPGPSEPSDPIDCGAYMWPEVLSPCPEVQIKQKHDHTPYKQYLKQGWDTVVTCSNDNLILSCTPYLPVQYFDGQYNVDIIPYAPADPTFARGTKMPVSTDDDFASEITHIPFDFFFFGIQKQAFVLGANGLVTFDTTAVGRYCPWKFSAPIPWQNNTTGAPKGMDCTVANMRDAIYGIYEDTHPIASYLIGDQGIYYGVQDEAPCRKIICSWNGIPTFPGSRNQNNRCTYQIVCYEGSNIIEVHVKHRSVNNTWQNANGLIGIQNATGQPQEQGDVLTSPSTLFVTPNSPAAFYPASTNLLTNTLDSIAFRFTPHGPTEVVSRWYRILDDGTDVNLTTDQSDTNGYYKPMQKELMSFLQDYPSCQSLTRAYVKPTCISRYVYNLKFLDASGNWYDLRDTITIGIDRGHTITMRPTKGTPADHQMDICAGDRAQITIEHPALQQIDSLHCTITRKGVELPDTLLQLGTLYEDEVTTLKRIPALLHPDEHASQLQPGEIDSINIKLYSKFINGCDTTINFMVRFFPSYNVTEHYEICNGETFHWNRDGKNYTQTTNAPKVNIPTVVGCDSIVHLDLLVKPTDFRIDYRNDCRPLTWINGQTYNNTNTETAATDTVHRINQYGCDSLIQLNFTLHPMKAEIEASLDHFDLDNLEVELTDATGNDDSRVWHFSNGTTSEAAHTYYTTPYDHDTTVIKLVAHSPYGCLDSTNITLPFFKDVIYTPNIFTPGRSDDNGIFSSKSRHLLRSHMRIFNRFGEMVYECEGIDCGWDGNDLDGNPCPQGSYVFNIRYTTEYQPHAVLTHTGAVTLIR